MMQKFFLFVQAHTITEMHLTYTPSVVGYIFVENVLRSVKLTANLKKESAENIIVTGLRTKTT